MSTTRTKTALETLNVSELIAYILEVHHRYVRESLPRISEQLDSCCRDDHHSPARHARFAFHEFADDMYMHMEKEEHVLFPLIQRLEHGWTSSQVCSLSRIIQVMEGEHQLADMGLTRVRDLLPAGPKYAGIRQELAEMERDLVDHVYAENEVLFPRALSLLD